MKVLNEQKIEELFSFIKTYQLRYGCVPSYRQIQGKLGFSSLSVVSRYVDQLCSRGKLEKVNDKIHLEAPSLSQTTIAPVVGVVTCGSPIYAQENIECAVGLPVDIFGRDDLFILHAEGDSMINAGIESGDLLVVKKSSTAENGDIVVALIDDSATTKRFFKRSDKVILHPENEKYEDIVCQNVQILGIVKYNIHKF